MAVLLTLLDEVHGILPGVIVIETVDQEVFGELADQVAIGLPNHLRGYMAEELDESWPEILLDLVGDDDAGDVVLCWVAALVDVPLGRVVPKVFSVEAVADDSALEELIQVDLDCCSTSKVLYLLIPERGVSFKRARAEPDDRLVLLLVRHWSMR